MVLNITKESRKEKGSKVNLASEVTFNLTLVGSCAVEWGPVQGVREKEQWVDNYMEDDKPLYQKSWLCPRNHFSRTYFVILKMLTLL